MRKTTLGLLNLLRLSAASITGRSAAIRGEQPVERYLSDPSNTALVSFPRTGSHWLRMLMERYFQQPSLVRVFYYPWRTNYLTYHTHDLDLNFRHPTVMYLYRGPVATIYSQLRYRGEDFTDLERVRYWSRRYADHLFKWMVGEGFTNKKSLISYDRMKWDLSAEFKRVTDHFGRELNRAALQEAASAVTKQSVRKKTPHDERVVRLEQDYRDQREKFRDRFSEAIWEIILQEDPEIAGYFPMGDE